jgi:hypothetical protein
MAASVYLDTGLVKFMFHGATLITFFPVFAGIAIAARHWKLYRPFGRAVLAAGLVAVVLNLDTVAVREAEFLKNEFRAAGAVDLRILGKSVERLQDMLPGSSSDDTDEGPTQPSDDLSYLAAAGTWVDENTPIDALLVVPPRDVNAGFRVLSRRATVVVHKDGGNSKYSNVIAQEWRERHMAVTSAYDTGTWQALRAVAQRYGAEIVLAPRDVEIPSASILYSNAAWIVASADGP